MFPLRDTQPSYSKPVVTVLLIVVNILVFLFEFSLDPYTRNAFISAYGLVPDHFAVTNIFTSMFLHAGWLHVLGNMWFLRSEEHTSELQSLRHLVCRLLLEKKKNNSQDRNA